MEEHELIDIINDLDEVIDTVDRNIIYEKNLRHRIVHLIVLNDKAEIALQKRTMNKSYLPGGWSTTVGGHVLTGETYEDAIRRESFEEIEVIPKYEFKVKFDYVDSSRNLPKSLAVYTAQINDLSVSNYEIDRIEYFTIKEIEEMIKNGESFHPELLYILKNYFGLNLL